jgi:hypothetical protein
LISNNLQFIADNLTPITDLLDGYRQTLADTTGPICADLATRHRALITQEADMDLNFLREEIPMAATQAIEGTQRVARIVRAMKAFAHPGGEGKDLNDLNEAIRNTLIVADSEINQVADVALDLAADLPPVLCNLGDINQAVLNVVINVAHAITDAGASGSTGWQGRRLGLPGPRCRDCPISADRPSRPASGPTSPIRCALAMPSAPPPSGWCSSRSRSRRCRGPRPGS